MTDLAAFHSHQADATRNDHPQYLLGVTAAATYVALTDATKLGKLVGEIFEYPVGTVPAWALELNGQSVLRATYPALFALWGTTFGSADGTHFNVLDRRGRVTVHQDATADFDVIGEHGGLKTVTLTSAQSGVPAHTHGSVLPQGGGGGTNNPGARMSGAWTNNAATTAASVDAGVAANTPADAASSHTNLQPYEVTRFLVRAL